MTTQTRDLRQAKRRRVLMTATLIGLDGAQSVRVRDLTSGGAGISCERPPKPGTDVIFKRGSLSMAARVAWVDGKGAGLEFYREMALPELADALTPETPPTGRKPRARALQPANSNVYPATRIVTVNRNDSAL